MTQYNGEWKNGKSNGQGCFIYSNGDRYKGSWANGQMDGHGKYSFQSSETYDGGWKLNRHHGDGKFTYESGNVYDGQWRHGKKKEMGSLNMQMVMSSHANIVTTEKMDLVYIGVQMESLISNRTAMT